ncbi:MAG: cupin domain-containing protein [Gammaproteobacteria bacterium]|uniref:cupin domain-containing protein n=1 Tax=Pseudomaricurvus alcaniphilus TaxID=1166482 RepID=UPI00140D23B9|nr:cupin domain-containing protein [Pseudomaricurvus alcaniphilus]MBR9911456.1 cupin domain-containing protein [Gammaproteobacteria bacterium]NHN36798.1 cupin domain-containing protein [Pseudomaricurvus alcaniphilus]
MNNQRLTTNPGRCVFTVLLALAAVFQVIGSAPAFSASVAEPHAHPHSSTQSGFEFKIWNLDNTVKPFNREQVEATNAGGQFWFVNKQELDGRTLKMSIVRPGNATHPPHTHAEDEFFFVLEGTAEFHLNGEVRRVGPYTSLYCPPHALHGIRNVGEVDLKYLVIKKYQDVQ